MDQGLLWVHKFTAFMCHTFLLIILKMKILFKKRLSREIFSLRLDSSAENSPFHLALSAAENSPFHQARAGPFSSGKFSFSPGARWPFQQRKILLFTWRALALSAAENSPHFSLMKMSKSLLEKSQHDKKKFKDASVGRPSASLAPL